MGWFNFTKKGVNDIGIDLGTVNTLISSPLEGIILNEPSVVAIDQSKNPPRLMEIGANAHQMIGRTPEHIRAIRPLREGVIAEVEWAEVMLKRFLDRALKQKFFSIPPRLAIGIPASATAVERRAVGDAAFSAGARAVHLIEEPLAAAVGANVPVDKAMGSMIIDIGGGTTEIAVLSLNGIVASKSIRIAGDHLNQDVKTYLERQYHLMVGDRTAEEIKIRIGSAVPAHDVVELEIRGVNTGTGLPSSVVINSEEIRGALQETLQQMVIGIRSILEETPPELVADIMDQGIVLTGGGSLLEGLDEYFAQQIEVPVRLAPNPLESVVRGTERILSDPAFQRILEYTLYDPHASL